MKATLRSVILLGTLAWACGCGDDGGSTNDTQSSGDTGGAGGTTGGASGAGGTSSVGGSGGSLEPSGGTGGMPPESGPLMNTTNANLIVTPYNTISEGLEVVSSNLLTRPSADRWFERWYLVVENKGLNILCYVQAEAEFRRNGVSITDHYSFADGPAYKVSTSSLSAPCLAPGDRGVVYSNGFADENYQAETIDEVEVTLLGEVFAASIIHPSAPSVTGAAGNWRVSGTATSNETIYNIGMDVYPYDEKGLVFDRLLAFHLDTFYEGANWNYETNAADSDFTEYEQYVDFIEGTAAFMEGPPDPDAKRLSELERKLQKQRETLEENEKIDVGR